MDVVQDVQPGQFVDACDRYGKWYEAEIKEILPNKAVDVHFLGWSTVFDESISVSAINSHIAPLYSHSPDRRNWKIGDKIHYRCTFPCAAKPIWIVVRVEERNDLNDTLAIQVDGDQVRRALEKLSMPLTNGKPAGTVWLGLLSDEVVPLYTHTRYPPTPPLSRGSASFPAPLKTSEHEPKPQQAVRSCWIAPLLRERQVSEQHITTCERALVFHEGFTDAALFASMPIETEKDMAAYLNKIGISARGVQLKIFGLHKALQTDRGSN